MGNGLAPALSLPGVEMYVGDAAAVVRELDATYHKRVNMVTTSPPYFNLRDYGTATWEGGNPTCDHDVKRQHGSEKVVKVAQSSHVPASERLNRQVCTRCGARRIDLQIGSEGTIDAYLARLCDLFGLIADTLLRDDGSVWVNIADSYAGSGGAGGDYNEGGLREGQPKWKPPTKRDFPAKCLQMVPERFALEMIRRGWILRNKVIWFKGKEPAAEGAPPSNGMPSSAPDRLKNTWEYVFHFTRQGQYYYDLDAIREPLACPDAADFFWGGNKHDDYGPRTYSGKPYGRRPGTRPAQFADDETKGQPPGPLPTALLGRNPGDLWFIPTQGFPLAHYATYPPRLVHIPAGATLPRAVCKACGAPVMRHTCIESHANYRGEGQKHDGTYYRPNPGGGVANDTRKKTDCGYRPTCSCHVGYEGAICLDPFGGSGATAQGVMEAVKPFAYEGCMCEPKTILIDLDPRNVEITRKRLTGQARQSKRVDKQQFGGRDLLDMATE